MKTKNLALIVILGLIVLVGGCVGCGSISFQKKGVALDENVKAKFANVQSEYQRRSDLIPNLVSTVKGEANFEQTTLENVIKARASATQIKVDPNDLTPEKLQEFQQAQGQLSQALGRLLVVTENYPNLRANDAFRGLQVQLEGTENRIKVARNDFNTAVQEYNTTIRTFPNNFYAGWFGFTPKQPFQADAGAEKAPSVDFDKK
ncbi:LemA family protein [Parafilimonas terrae]|uniref:LemA protein n=1 Tax=Parafilimonas terrae TaxID=1465490 RepID=A0A1I5ZAD3_9BACT|nr:LemA family protein [Parafilimonas terrae]SFQ53439.1 LemA protein [Parafilimonas terrae]